MNQTIQRVLFAGQSKGLYRTAFSCTMQISHSFSRLDHGKFCQIDLDQDHAKLESLTFVETLLTCTCTSTAFTVTDANDFSGGVTTHLCGVVSSDLGERKVPRFFSKFGVELFKIWPNMTAPDKPDSCLVIVAAACSSMVLGFWILDSLRESQIINSRRVGERERERDERERTRERKKGTVSQRKNVAINWWDPTALHEMSLSSYCAAATAATIQVRLDKSDLKGWFQP